MEVLQDYVLEDVWVVQSARHRESMDGLADGDDPVLHGEEHREPIADDPVRPVA